MHMRKSATLLAALLTATPAFATEQCLKLKNVGFKYGDTAHCFVRIDGQVIIDRTCHISISGDTHGWAMDGVAQAHMEGVSTRPPVLWLLLPSKKMLNPASARGTRGEACYD
jgi:hypothetical protein